MYQIVFFKDRIVSKNAAALSIASSAVLYGLSVYTVFTICVDEQGSLQAFRLKDHFRRLVDSARIIGIDTFETTWTYEGFADAVKELVRENKVKRDVYIRATVHVDEELAGVRSRGLSSSLSMFIYDAQPILSPKGCRLKTSVWRRVPDYAIPSRAKVNGAYINSVLAKQDALDSGYDDCIFLDVQGHVCELSAANVFVVRSGEVITPSRTNDLLEGVNRHSVMKIVRNELDLEVQEREIDLTELYVADEVFATGTSTNITPVFEIDARSVGDGSIGPITKKLQKIHSDVRTGAMGSYRNWLTKV